MKGVRDRAIPAHPSVPTPADLFTIRTLISAKSARTDSVFCSRRRAAGPSLKRITEGFDTLVKLPQKNFDPQREFARISLKETVVCPPVVFRSPPSIHPSFIKPAVVMETSILSKGTVKWFNEKKGFGFIVDPLVPGDIFVHFSAIETDGFKTLTEGEQVAYELFTDDKGAKARKVQRLG
jgi:CspA family cold shock protein